MNTFPSIFSVVSQFYESQVYDEYVIKGNAAILKCHIPSFVVDHVEIIEWTDSNGGHYPYKEDSSGIRTFLLQPSTIFPILFSTITPR